ncbi:hypothetical protein NVS55_21740 [Myxococcus stipitatus]|uniref:hypothetical protein n=1 Tax=Myxococcus stipitatus TaxID=83455 RepID=UPI00314544A3
MREAPASPHLEDGAAAISIEIDGQTFHLHPGVTSGAPEVEASTGGRFQLHPWSFDSHLRALGVHAWLDGAGMSFDAEGFASDVLRGSGVPESLFTELTPLALWWALGGARESSLGTLPEGWVQAGDVRARLRPWTFSERARVVEESLTLEPDGTRELNLERYLRAMLAVSVVEIVPAVPMDTLDGASTTALLEAVVAINTGDERNEDQTLRTPGAQARVLAEVTLKLCRALGWTPSQVWATPAAEVDRLLALLRLTEAHTPAPAPKRRTPRLSDFPDAVVIQVEDD